MSRVSTQVPSQVPPKQMMTHVPIQVESYIANWSQPHVSAGMHHTPHISEGHATYDTNEQCGTKMATASGIHYQIIDPHNMTECHITRSRWKCSLILVHHHSTTVHQGATIVLNPPE